MNIVAISGSLRAASINSAVCRLATRLAPPVLRVSVFEDLEDLPLFNPDLEASPPETVRRWRATVDAADALLIASPEYAHGISGVMKNALDWLVSFEGTVGKPVALVNAAPRAHHADAALREVLRTMSAEIVADASQTLPLAGHCTTEAAMLAQPDVCRALEDLLAALLRHLRGEGGAGPSFPLA
ncbi:NAD(P)H-dependent oxidoreductase [Hylemonella gracilis]|uniref:NAD(P)H-dependent oxidoreductase n=1 Tax=Hylemonella gracilis TaxID=80880 RepID=A0A4P6UNA8_9BURK|nr:NADPH-dependent FMN reductase [Hylemonella gracilis]QBK06104.1 NAD(P)H-dependent oxidoreductase [Hylemonella gracilis]